MVAEGVRRMLATDPAIAFHYVSDPKQAIESATKVGPTVILQDLVMPGVNGLDLLKEYRSNPLTRAIPVIVLSSKEDPAIKQMAFESGANDYMVKLPHRIEMLARIRLHSEAYTHELQRQRAYLALETSQRKLTEKNCELEILNQKLEEATRFKSVFFANVSHEIRTPLIGVLGMAEILSDTSLDIHQRELVDVIRTSGETLLHIINDILDLSKIESGKLELESMPFVLRDVVDQVMDLLAPIAFGKRLEISAWIDPRIATIVVGDITRIRQVLLNLLNNAIKFTSSGEIYLWVEPSMDVDNLVHFCVEDTGLGIPAEKLDRLFRSFSQVDSSTNRRFGGTGLGLSICRNLTALMGGRIWVESTVGKGTQFHFIVSLPPAELGDTSSKSQDLRGRRMVALVQNARLIRLLSAWAEELALELIVRTDQPEYLDNTQLDYLVIDTDQSEIQIPTFSPVTVLLLTRPKNMAEFVNRYPGATVLSLPLKKRRFLQAVGVIADAKEVNSTPEADPILSALNILVVDDNTVNRRVCIAQLQKLGVWTVSEAADGRQAIAATQNEAFDLVFMDVQMPEIDGLEATRQIRLSLSNSDSRQPRIIGLTANAFSEERESCLKAGMDDKLTKPVHIEELKKVLEATSRIVSPDRPSPRSGSVLPVCDERQLNELLRMEGGDEFVTKVLQLFIEQAEELASRLPELADEPEVLASEAHKLKSAAGYVGAKRAAYFCGIVENTAKSPQSQLHQRTVADLKVSLNISVDDYRKRVKRN
jgi:signal transduction histidine kinase/ActR/RegA family two-component response regulator/HPt (histidine-containing phosphotransfer) domain-containing protein